MRSLDPQDHLIIMADDPIAKLDLPYAAREKGYKCEQLPCDTSLECVFKVTR